MSCAALQAQPLLHAPPKLATAEADVGLLFQQASVKTTAEGDPFFSHWHLRWAEQATAQRAAGTAGGAAAETEASAAGAGSAPEAAAAAAPALPAWHPSHTPHVSVPALDGWDGLYLESTVDWPLQLLFTPEVGVRNTKPGPARVMSCGRCSCRRREVLSAGAQRVQH